MRQTPDGILHWTSPTGRHYPDRPARTLVFMPDVGPDRGGGVIDEFPAPF